jgi:ABC-type glycerol-3-phosphate transport system substrate-binding protein
MLMATASCGREARKGYSNPRATESIDFSQDPVTITYLTLGDKPTNKETEKAIDKLNKILEKQLNAGLDIFYIGWNDYLTNYNRILASDEVDIDLVGTGTDWLDAWPNVMAGNFMPLTDDMLRNYCGVTYTNVSKSLWQSCSYDGNIYMIPENEYTQWTNHGFMYRKDLAAEAGISEIRSWEDMDRYFENVVKNHPDMIAWDIGDGFDTAILGYIMSARKYMPIYELTSYGIFGADQGAGGKLYSPYYTGDELLEYARLMKKWNDMGVWREDVALTGDSFEEFYKGETSVIQQHTQYYYTRVKPSMEIIDPDAELGFFWFGRESGNLVRTSNLHGAMAVSADSKNPERALMVYDMLRNDEECYRLLQYGIEGEQYNINASGMLERPSGYNENMDSIVTNFWWGRRDELEIPDSTYAWSDYYDLVTSYEHLAVNYPWEGIPFSTPQINKEMKKIVEVCDKYVPMIATGQYDKKPEDLVKEFRYELMSAGIERVMGQLQRILDSR